MTDVDTRLRLTAGDSTLAVSPHDGGRIASLVVAGRELLARVADEPIFWGSYPMAPYAGRVRDGRFTFAGRDWTLPLGMPPHAIHGVVYNRPWTIVDDATIAIDLADPWPFAGCVIQRFALEPGLMRVTMELHADEPMPASVGWHPWFRRHLDPGTTDDVELRFEPEAMFERDEAGIPTGRLVPPPPRPWDDCFVGVRSDPMLRWPDGFELTVGSSCECWVVFDQHADAICIEPQTAPPDALNQGPTIVEPGTPLIATMEWRWRTGPG
jgi:aldose 1-epimerase